MAKEYIPKANDPVFVAGKGESRFIVKSVDANKKTVSVEATSGGPVTFQHHDISWSRLSKLDDSQNALRIVREATEH